MNIKEAILPAAKFSPDTGDTTVIIFIALGIIAIALFILIRRRR